MKPITHILLPTDFSECAERAFGLATMLAKRFSAKLTMLHVVTAFDDDPYNPEKKFPDLQEFYRELEKQAEGNLESVIDKDAKGLKVNYSVCRGFSASEEILDFAAENDINLIVMGTHGRKSLSHLLLGSVAEKVVQHARCPVLTTRRNSSDSVLFKGFNRILVPTDFSDYSKRALQFAVILLAPHGSLDILHVVEDNIHPAYYAGGQTSIFDIIPDLRQRSAQFLEKFIKENVSASLNAVAIVGEGRIAQQILRYADENPINAVVMGSRGMNDLEQLFLGSVTERIVRKASQPVVNVK